LQDAQGRTAQPKEGKKRRETASAQGESVSSHRAGVRGTVLAYNQVYNFVVLNLGARNGVESNSEMLILREGTLIGKIRISSVEPATAIGDIIPSSLARGVQVQPGDTVIYGGTNPERSKKNPRRPVLRSCRPPCFLCKSTRLRKAG